jgi:hypothetical protein
MSRLRVLLLSRRTTGVGPGWGLGQDSRLLETMLREIASRGDVALEVVEHEDPMSYVGGERKPRSVDIAIHLEVPCRAAFPWAKTNWVVVNPEWWPATAWDWVLAPVEKGGAHLLVFKSAAARALYPTIEDRRAKVVPWRASPDLQLALSSLSSVPKRAFLYMVGASAHKEAAASVVCRAWKAAWPPLLVVATTTILDGLAKANPDAAARGIELHPPYKTDAERCAVQASYGYHVVASVAEGFGYTFAEAAAVGALPLWTDIPVYSELWGPVMGAVGRITTEGIDATSVCREPRRIVTEAAVVAAVEELLRLPEEDAMRLRGHLKHVATTKVKDFRLAWKQIVARWKPAAGTISAFPVRMPSPDALPHVALITLTHDRPKWFANMATNVLQADYPADKITWVIADDSPAGGRVDEQVMRFQSKNPHIRVRYISIPTKMAIGAKRNKACDSAPADATVYVMMDDDDHYPKQSVATRVAYLLQGSAGSAGSAGPIGCVYCATLPMYHCGKYISAMNVPPLILSPAERVSEASLAFTRAFFEAGRFPDSVSVAEGEGFLTGRSEQTREIPPDGVLVSFLHGNNATSRRVPELVEPNGCHYGFTDEYFSYLCGLAKEEASSAV